MPHPQRGIACVTNLICSFCSVVSRFDLVNRAPGRSNFNSLTTLPRIRRGWGRRRRRAKAGRSLRNAKAIYRPPVSASPLFIFIHWSALRLELEGTLYIMCFSLFMLSFYSSCAFCSFSRLPPFRFFYERRGFAEAKQVASRRKTRLSAR